MSFDHQTLDLWSSTPEVEIETSRGPGAPVHLVTIWIVVDGEQAYVRSVRGSKGRWFREIMANPRGAVVANGRRVAVDAEPATDEASIVRVSELINSKYQQRWPGPTAAMIRDDVLPTTLRLLPALQ